MEDTNLLAWSVIVQSYANYRRITVNHCYKTLFIKKYITVIHYSNIFKSIILSTLCYCISYTLQTAKKRIVYCITVCVVLVYFTNKAVII
jgi:hypothetical protein